MKNIESGAAVTPDSAMEYFLNQDGEKSGPYDEAQLRAMLADGEVAADALVQTKQSPDWAPIEDVLAESTSATQGAGDKPTSPKTVGIAVAGLALAGVAIWYFGFRDEAPNPRSSNEIFADSESLPALFFGGKSKKRIIAQGNKQFFLDAKSKEICWRAMTCTNPNCPALKAGSEPPIFINPNPAVVLHPDGTLGHYPDRAAKAVKAGPLVACPECLKTRDVATETSDTKEKYLSWVRPYVLPETAKRLKELEAERKSRSGPGGASP